tara:strand:- start:95 stop:373 length:279 start_codon:yes stop_codon:yes gene_type:complete
MAKKLQNMTQDERIAYWENYRAKEAADRWRRMNHLTHDQRATVLDTQRLLQEMLDTALDMDMGGIKAVTVYDLQKLQEMADKLHYHFNMGDE